MADFSQNNMYLFSIPVKSDNVVNCDMCFRVTVRWLSNLCILLPIVNIHEMQSFRWVVYTMQRH